MKLWTKIYIITLALFLVLINIGFYTVFSMTYKKDINAEKEIAKTTFEMIESSLEKSMKTMNEDNRLVKNSLSSLIQITEKYYHNQNVELMLYSDTEIIYSKDNIKKDEKLFKSNAVFMTRKTEKDIPVIYITKKIDEYDNNYYLCYRKPLNELYSTWENLQNKYMLMSGGCSLVLAILLFIILNSLMKPIQELSKAVDKVKSDGYDSPSHVRVKGHDDVATLGASFNEMSDIIAENIKEIRLESEKKQQFVDNFAHELKTPLTSIYGFAEYIAKANVSDEEKEECMQFIMDESKRMLEMAYNLMDLSEIRSKEVVKENIDIMGLKNKIESILKEKIISKNINLEFDINVSKIFANKSLIESLIANIIANAINASSVDGKIDITISKGNGMNKFMIKDYGCGMNEDELQHIFEPFYRADKSRSRKNGSSGLGLSICKQIVEAHNGRIYYWSEKGKGTIVTILLPLTDKI